MTVRQRVVLFNKLVSVLPPVSQKSNKTMFINIFAVVNFGIIHWEITWLRSLEPALWLLTKSCHLSQVAVLKVLLIGLATGTVDAYDLHTCLHTTVDYFDSAQSIILTSGMKY